jgi:hypothetical protein
VPDSNGNCVFYSKLEGKLMSRLSEIKISEAPTPEEMERRLIIARQSLEKLKKQGGRFIYGHGDSRNKVKFYQYCRDLEDLLKPADKKK